jgi:hypothetical protein
MASSVEECWLLEPLAAASAAILASLAAILPALTSGVGPEVGGRDCKICAGRRTGAGRD